MAFFAIPAFLIWLILVNGAFSACICPTGFTIQQDGAASTLCTVATGNSDGSCYLFVPGPMNRQTAASVCRQLNGVTYPGGSALAAPGVTLAKINDFAEQSFILTQNTGPYWIGLNDISSEGFYLWDGYTIGTTELLPRPWVNGVPSNSNCGSGCTEDCVHLMPNDHFWNDNSCAATSVAPLNCGRLLGRAAEGRFFICIFLPTWPGCTTTTNSCATQSLGALCEVAACDDADTLGNGAPAPTC